MGRSAGGLLGSAYFSLAPLTLQARPTNPEGSTPAPRASLHSDRRAVFNSPARNQPDFQMRTRWRGCVFFKLERGKKKPSRNHPKLFNRQSQMAEQYRGLCFREYSNTRM